MKITKIILFLVAILFIAGCATDNTKVITGYIAIKGSAPHSYVVIEDKEHHKEYKIDNAKAFDLASKQKQNVTIEVSWVKEAVGPGFPAVIKVIKLL